jgi:hypothetical protein
MTEHPFRAAPGILAYFAMKRKFLQAISTYQPPKQSVNSQIKGILLRLAPFSTDIIKGILRQVGETRKT